MKKKIKKFLVNCCASFIFDTKKRREFRKKFFSPQPEPCKIGKYSYHGGLIVAHHETVIGKYCCIGTNVAIGPSQHPINWLSSSPIQYIKNFLDFPTQHTCDATRIIIKPCTVGNDVWIGINVVIMDGVNIGDGAIIGSGSVVTHDVPPYAIVVGVPARVIRYRFDKKTINELLKLKWWDLPDEVVATLPFNDIKKCIKQLKEYEKKNEKN